ncbi:MAG: isoaspartyl peptidase/L-asparaginase [Gammaproteobacteria bacterium]|nr:isoaspartyl peptidase/L-asparaginase [Gammaproteobacteria bacterium]MDH3432123.1 isoaspartyl peptidase/L-asparaginase [Gammaproteobacteria bacterium]
MIRGKSLSAVTVIALLCGVCAVGDSQESEVCDSQDRHIILVHGGITTSMERVNDAQMNLIRTVVTEARADLAAGAAALDVVVDAIAVMEDSGLYDAGKGSYLNTAGYTETDASLMEGHTGKTGAVAAMQRLKNPIKAARIVMEDTRHVFFAGPTGEEVLIGLGAEKLDDPASYFVPIRTADSTGSETGTVGAVALDRCGHLAAGTSTGGYFGKMPGRVGDSPIIGASTFANDRYALSSSGRGENFIQRSVTIDIAMRSMYRGTALQDAADYVIHRLIGDIDQVTGAIIAISKDGEIVLSGTNVIGIRHGYASESGGVTIGLELP